jgi:TorA maturation chaperone TorD
MMLKSSIVFALEARAVLYAVLAASFRGEPSAAVLTELTDRVSFLKGNMGGQPLSGLQQSIASLLKALMAATPEALAGDYADLFLSGKNSHLAPSESAYLEETIYGQATVDVIETYAEFGFIREESFREPHDHIALECAFMAALAVELLEHARGGDRNELKRLTDAQASFVELHMGRWVPGWAKRVTVAAGTAFYKAVAELAYSFIAADRNLLARLSGLFSVEV